MSTPVSALTSAVLPWSMCPAVPSVSGVIASLQSGPSPPPRRPGSPRRRASADRAADPLVARARSRPARPAQAGEISAGSIRRAAGRRARELQPGQRAAADARLRARRARPHRSRRAAASPARQLRGERRASPAPGSAGAAVGLAIQRAASPPAPPTRACPSAAPEPAGGAARRHRLLAPDQQARLRAAEQLVAAEGDERGPRPHRALDRRLVGSAPGSSARQQHAGADVVDHRPPSAHSCSISTSCTNPTVRKFDGWTLSTSVGARFCSPRS